MKYLFNDFGWYAGAIAGSDLPRATAIAPPEHGNVPVIGQPWPNWSGFEWVMANYTAPPAPPAPTYDWRISCLAFRNRFTQAEKVALYTARATNVAIDIYLDDVQAATYIDLSRADTQATVNWLEAEGFLAAGRANVILTTVPTQSEAFTG